MGRQIKNLQLKGMEDSSLKELNEIEVSKLSDIEFKRMVKGCSRNSQTTPKN